MERKIFRLITLKEATDFIHGLPDKAREKVFYNIRKVQAGVRDDELFKKLNDNIWEFRTLWQGTAYRLFAFWDKETETLIVATHGISKKTQKTPNKEINKAETIRKEYFNSKNK